jgi:hypothetical protein
MEAQDRFHAQIDRFFDEIQDTHACRECPCDDKNRTSVCDGHVPVTDTGQQQKHVCFVRFFYLLLYCFCVDPSIWLNLYLYLSDAGSRAARANRPIFVQELQPRSVSNSPTISNRASGGRGAATTIIEYATLMATYIFAM